MKKCQVLPQIVPLLFGEDDVNLDETVSAVCTITKGDLPIDIWWTFSDGFEPERNLTSGDGVDILRRNQKISMLNIENVKARHRGNYTCYGQNRGGLSQQTAILAINGDLFMLFCLIVCFFFAPANFAICFQ